MLRSAAEFEHRSPSHTAGDQPGAASSVDVLLIGGGILGLTTAWTIHQLRPNAKIALVEKEARVAQHQSGHNSGVLHSGIYYPPGSLKAELCLAGYKLMKAFCEHESMPIRFSGKLIVAADEHENTKLKVLFERGKRHGLKVAWLTGEQAKEIEPHVRCHAAVHVPETAVLDYSRVCDTLFRRLKDAGVHVLLGTKFRGAVPRADGVTASTDGHQIEARAMINCGGLQCDRIATRSGAHVPGRIVPFRGDYYNLRAGREHLVKRMIYPVPDPRFPFLGVHFTRAIDGTVHVGPNAVLSLAREGYSRFAISLADAVSTFSFPGFWKFSTKHLSIGVREMKGAFSRAVFARSAQKMIPELTADDLVPAGSGIRAQALSSNGQLVEDFNIVRQSTTWHIFNAPSPAATSSFAIADRIAREVIQVI